MSYLENNIDLINQMVSRYAIRPISGISGHNTTLVFNGLTSYICTGSSGTVTIGSSGGFCAILVGKGFNGVAGSVTSEESKVSPGTTITTYDPGDGGGTGYMKLVYGWMSAGSYSYNIDGYTTNFNGTDNFGYSTSFPNGIIYSTYYGAKGGGVCASSTNRDELVDNNGQTSYVLDFFEPLNSFPKIGGSGASGWTTFYGTGAAGGAGGNSGAAGIIRQSGVNGRSSSAYGGGGGGGGVFDGTGGTGGPGCVIIIPFETTSYKQPTSLISGITPAFDMGTATNSDLYYFLNENFITCSPNLKSSGVLFNDTTVLGFNNNSLSTSTYDSRYQFNTFNTINYISALGFKRMPISVTQINDTGDYATLNSDSTIRYTYSRNVSNNLYYMTILTTNSCRIYFNTACTVNFVSCGPGGGSNRSIGTTPSRGGGGGGVAVGSISVSVGSSLRLLDFGYFRYIRLINEAGTDYLIAEAYYGIDGSTTAAGTSGGAAVYSPATGTGYDGGGNGVNSATVANRPTINSGYSLNTTGFGGDGSAGSGTTSDGKGGNYGITGNSSSRVGIGYGAGAGGQRGSTTGLYQPGNPGIFILSFQI